MSSFLTTIVNSFFIYQNYGIAAEQYFHEEYENTPF